MKIDNKILQKVIFYSRDNSVKISMSSSLSRNSVDKHQIMEYSEFYNSERILNIDAEFQFPTPHLNHIKTIPKDKSHSMNKLFECRMAAGLKAFSPNPLLN